jgi:hypothetical protein
VEGDNVAGAAAGLARSVEIIPLQTFSESGQTYRWRTNIFMRQR